MKKNIRFILSLLLIFAAACTSDSESDLIDDGNGGDDDNNGGPITYNADISSLINSACLGCHSSPPRNGAPFALTTYDLVVTRAENGSLLTAISRQSGTPGAMPPSGRLPQATIDLIEQWIDDGLLEE